MVVEAKAVKVKRNNSFNRYVDKRFGRLKELLTTPPLTSIPTLAGSGSTDLPKVLTLKELGAVVAFWFFSATGKELGFRRQ